MVSPRTTFLIPLLVIAASPSSLDSAPFEFNLPPPDQSLRINLPKVLFHIFNDTYNFVSNTVVIVPGCSLPAAKDVQDDILYSLLLLANAEETTLAFEIQTDFSIQFDSATVTFLWFIDSRESFRRVFRGFHGARETLNHRGFFTVVCCGSIATTEEELSFADEIFRAFWAYSATNVLFLTSDDQRTTFYTFFLYSNASCGEPRTVAHNYYWHTHPTESAAAGAFQFDRPLFPRKCDNLFDCPVNVGTFQFPPFMLLGQRNGSAYFDGIEGIVTRVLSQRIHFTPLLVLPDDQERWGACDAKGTCTGALKLLLEERVNMTIGLFGTNTFRGVDSVRSSIPYYVVKVLFAVPRGRRVSNVEKLLLPFGYRIWCCIGACFTAGLLLVHGLKLCRPEVRRFVLGRTNRYPLITMANVWFGNSAAVLPGRNFARFLLAMWILLAFVLRSGYQAALFDILRLQKSLAPVDTVQKIVEAGYPVYASARLAKYVRQMDPRILPLLRIVATTEVDEYLQRTQEKDFQGVVVVVEPTLLHFNRLKANGGVQLIHSPVVIHSIQNVIYVDQRSCLLEAIDQELWRYLSSGLLSAWTTHFLRDPVGKTDSAPNLFMPLEWRDVVGIFQVYAILICLIAFVLAGEVVADRRRRRGRRRRVL